MTDRLHLEPRHRQVLETLLRKHLPDVEVWAYGSRVNGRSHDGSDLDLVLRGPKLEEIPLRQIEDFEEALRESTIPFLVEARDWARLPERFHREIERGYVALTEPPGSPADDARTKARLGECIEFNDSTYSPRKDAWPFVNYLDTGNITENRIATVQRFDLDKDTLPVRARRKVRPGDIVLSTVRPNQRHFGVLRDTPRNFLASTGFAVFRGRADVADTDYLYWFLTQDRIVDQLQTIAEHSTSAYPSIRPADIENLEIDLPPLAEQRAIAHILGSLDDKIDLNRRMNQTLEAMAQAVFKDWFVDFGPVRAKMEGRAPYLPPDIWDLFPDRLVDSELGEIPEGWEVGRLGDIADVRRHLVDPARAAHDTPYIGLAHMPRGSIALTDWGTTGNVSSPKSAFEAQDILFGKLRPYFHKVGLAPLDGLCSTDIIVLRARKPHWSAFVLACVSSSAFVEHTSLTSTGTRMPRTSWQAMATYRVCLPSHALVSTFHRAASSMAKRIVENAHSIRSTRGLRNAVLPKLVSANFSCYVAAQRRTATCR